MDINLEHSETNTSIFDTKNENYIKLLEFIVKEVNKLPKEKHIDIFAIIDKYTHKYSENINGIFVNLSELDTIIVKEIYDYIVYLNIQEKNINDIEKEKELYSNILNNT